MLKQGFKKIISAGDVALNVFGAKEIFDVVKNLAKGEKTQGTLGKIVEKAVEAKGLKDEGLFADALRLAEKQRGVSPQKIIFLRKCFRKIAEEDKRQGTKFFRNIRLAVLSADLDKNGKITIPKKNKRGDIVGAVEVTDPDYVPSSVAILANMARRCRLGDEEDLLTYLYSMDVFQDAPMGTLDEFQFWVENTLFPKMQKVGEGLAFYTELFTEEVSRKMEAHYLKEVAREQKARDYPWKVSGKFWDSVPIFLKKITLVIFER